MYPHIRTQGPMVFFKEFHCFHLNLESKIFRSSYVLATL